MALDKRTFVHEYLERIEYTGDTAPTLENLYAMQIQHIYAVPFENLDILAGIPVSLDYEYLFHRIVTLRRGGVCYELNRSFYNLLSALGYRVDYISGQVRMGGTLLDHALSVVHLEEGDFAVDVGFGDNVLPPVLLRHASRRDAFGWIYTVAQQGELFHLLRRQPGQLPQRMYTLTTVPRSIEDVMGRFRRAATPGNSPYSRYHVCTWERPDGRFSLIGQIFTVEKNGVTTVFPAKTQTECAQYLRQYFNLP